MLVVHTKSQRFYNVITYATDTTRIRSGERVAVYAPVEDEFRFLVCREDEFNEQFKPAKVARVEGT